jgi:hypothetical protein
VIDASPARLDRALRIEIPVVRVRYRFEQTFGPSIFGLVEDLIQTHVRLMSESS